MGKGGGEDEINGEGGVFKCIPFNSLLLSPPTFLMSLFSYLLFQYSFNRPLYWILFLSLSFQIFLAHLSFYACLAYLSKQWVVPSRLQEVGKLRSFLLTSSPPLKLSSGLGRGICKHITDCVLKRAVIQRGNWPRIKRRI